MSPDKAQAPPHQIRFTRAIMVGRWLLLFLLVCSDAQTTTTTTVTSDDRTSHDSWQHLLRHRFLQGFGVGAVIETPPPTVSPTTATMQVTPGDDWMTSSLSVHYRLYTVTDEAQIAAHDAVETLWTETLQSFVGQQNLAISLERFVTRSLGPCEAVGVPPFPDFTVCHIVVTTVRTRSDVSLQHTPIATLLPPTLFVDELIPIWNQHRTEGRVEWHDPVVVVASTLTFLLHGVDAVLNEPEAAFFTNQLWSLLEDNLGDDSASHPTQHVPLMLEQVQIVNQTSSSGEVSGAGGDTTTNSSDTKSLLGTRRFRALQADTTVSGANDGDDGVWNRVQVALSATCAYASTCAPEALRQAVSASEHTYGDLLMITLLMGNNADDLVYFDNLTNITIVAPPVPPPPPPPPAEADVVSPPAATTSVPGRKRRIPQWFWILILISISFIVTSLLYVCVRQTIRAMQDDSEHPDHYARENRHDRPLRSNESVDFSASVAPTLSQVKDFEPREQYPQHAVPHTPPPQQRGVFSFVGHKKDQQNNHKKSVQEMEDEDYDNRSYDVEEFSVHPHDFQQNQEDEFEEEQQEDDYYDDGYDSREDDHRLYQEEERRRVRDEDQRRRRDGDRNRGSDHRRRGGGGGSGRDEKRRGGRKR